MQVLRIPFFPRSLASDRRKLDHLLSINLVQRQMRRLWQTLSLDVSSNNGLSTVAAVVFGRDVLRQRLSRVVLRWVVTQSPLCPHVRFDAGSVTSSGSHAAEFNDCISALKERRERKLRRRGNSRKDEVNSDNQGDDCTEYNPAAPVDPVAVLANGFVKLVDVAVGHFAFVACC